MNDDGGIGLRNETDLPQDITNNLKYYEDYINVFVQIDSSNNDLNWMKADLLLHMFENLGDGSIGGLAKDLDLSYSTLHKYIRTATAFPPNKRIKIVSFAKHYHVSLIDPIDVKTRTIPGKKRFRLLKEIADNKYTVEQVQDLVAVEKLKEKKLIGESYKIETHEECLKMIHSVMKISNRLKTRLRAGDAGAVYHIKKLYKLAKEIDSNYDY